MKLDLSVHAAFNPRRIGELEQPLLRKILAKVEDLFGRLWTVDSKYQQL
jgi:hypothetical protein